MELHTLEGSWDDAEQQCVKHGMHLWSINNHMEWWNLYSISGTKALTALQLENDNEKIQSTVLLFIGLRLSDKEYYKVVYQMKMKYII